MKANGHDIRAGANLRGAYLRDANLQDADLEDANLEGANLRYANLQDAYLRYANLRDANLRYANLRDANLRYANLRYANLRDAYLWDADLEGADLEGAKLPHFQIPDGTLVGWKKIKGCIVELLIPGHARRTASLVGRKCRCEMALVRRIEGAEELSSRGVTYREGQEVWPDAYNDDPRVECTNGIHFFLTRAEAEEW